MLSRQSLDFLTSLSVVHTKKIKQFLRTEWTRRDGREPRTSQACRHQRCYSHTDNSIYLAEQRRAGPERWGAGTYYETPVWLLYFLGQAGSVKLWASVSSGAPWKPHPLAASPAAAGASGRDWITDGCDTQGQTRTQAVGPGPPAATRRVQAEEKGRERQRAMRPRHRQSPATACAGPGATPSPRPPGARPPAA